MADILGKESLDILRTKYIYKNFDDEKGICKDFSFYSEAEQELISHKNLQGVSDKILKAVCYVYNRSKRRDFDAGICNFLYFWLGNTLLSNLNNKDFLSEVIIKLFHSLNENGKRIICNIPYTDMDEGNFKKIKLIFDYFEDYSKYTLDLALHNRSCNEDYHTYLKKYVEAYKQLYTECKQQSKQNKYCQVFREKYDSNKHDNLYSWSCKLKKNLSEDNLLPGKPRDLESREKLDDERRGEKPETQAQQTPVMKPPIHVKNQETSGPSLHDITSGIAITSDDSTTSITSKSITGAVSVAGALVPSYLLYNYTPAGNLINKLLGRTTRMNHNPLMEAQLINNFYQPEGYNSQRSGYNVSYRPV